jgi:hypothetical protein
MNTIPEHVVTLLDATIYSAFAQLPEGYDISTKRPGFKNICEQRQHADKMLQMLKHLGTNKQSEVVMHWERMSKTLKMFDFIDE